MTPAERREVALAYLTNPDLGSVSACARHFNRSRDAVSNCLRGPLFEALRRQVDEEAGMAAKRVLMGARLKAASAWVDQAIDAAAQRGDHKPSRDLLVATKVVEPLPSHSQNVFGGVQVNGKTVWRSPDGEEFDELPSDAGGAIRIGLSDRDVQVDVQTAPATASPRACR